MNGKVKGLLGISIWDLPSQQWPQDWKRSVFIPNPKKGNAKECSNYRTIALISHASKAGFSNTWTMNFQMFKLDLEKAEESKIKLPTSTGSLKKQANSRKTSISALLTMPKPLTVWMTTNCKILRDGNIWPSDLPVGKFVCRSGSNSYKWTWNNRLVPNRERSMSRLYTVTLLI